MAQPWRTTRSLKLHLYSLRWDTWEARPTTHWLRIQNKSRYSHLSSNFRRKGRLECNQSPLRHSPGSKPCSEQPLICSLHRIQQDKNRLLSQRLSIPCSQSQSRAKCSSRSSKWSIKAGNREEATHMPARLVSRETGKYQITEQAHSLTTKRSKSGITRCQPWTSWQVRGERRHCCHKVECRRGCPSFQLVDDKCSVAMYWPAFISEVGTQSRSEMEWGSVKTVMPRLSPLMFTHVSTICRDW